MSNNGRAGDPAMLTLPQDAAKVNIAGDDDVIRALTTVGADEHSI